MKVDFDKLSKSRPLGKGMYGIAYRVTIDGIDYVWKRQKILPSHRSKTLKSYLWRGIDFFRWLDQQSSKVREFFAPLISYRIVKCDYKHIRPSKGRNPIYPKLDASNYCLDQLIEDRGIGVQQSKIRWNTTLLSSYLLQISTAIDLMNRAGYRHGDLHAGNVTVQKTELTSLKLFGQELSTGGYRFRLIDYDEVVNRKFPISKDNEYRDRRMKKNAEQEMFAEWRRWLLVELFDYSKLRMQTKNQRRRLRYTTLHYNMTEWISKNKPVVFEKIKKMILRKTPEVKKTMEILIDDFDARSPGTGQLRTMFINLVILRYPAIWRGYFKGFSRPKPRFSERKIEGVIFSRNRRQLKKVLSRW